MRLSRFLQISAMTLAILFTVFVSLFALDVFEEYEQIWKALIALFIHLAPTYFLVGACIVAWKFPMIGGIIFLIIGIAFGIFFRQKSILGFMLIPFPPVIIGLLFLLSQIVIIKRKSP